MRATEESTIHVLESIAMIRKSVSVEYGTETMIEE